MADLTWEDIHLIRETMYEYNKEIREKEPIKIPMDKEYAEEILRRYKQAKDFRNWASKDEDYNCVNHICSACGGALVFENEVMCSNPPQYPYTCSKCGKRYVYRTDGTRWEW